MKTLEKQYLIEYETKLDAIQNKLDWMLSEGCLEYEMKATHEEWERLMDVINNFKNQLEG